MKNQVKAFDNYNEYGTEPVEINIKKYIKYIAYAWNNITQNTIKNCWLKEDPGNLYVNFHLTMFLIFKSKKKNFFINKFVF